jgi:hypothetical protein
MRFRALHEFTHKLPLIEPENDVAELGVDTKRRDGGIFRKTSGGI